MANEQQALRDWHRLFGLLLTDYFTDTPFEVEVESDVSIQQQFLDVVIVRRGRGRFPGKLPDGLEGLRAHNLITFKSHRETLDHWAMKELVAHSVAYRKLVSPSTSQLLSEEQFGLFAVSARFPSSLSEKVPWKVWQPGVYDCEWGTDVIRVIVARELPREPQNALLHLFSASPELVNFGQNSYKRRSTVTSSLVGILFQQFKGEGVSVAYTMDDFRRDIAKRYISELTPEEQQQVLNSIPLEARLAGLTEEQIRQYLQSLSSAQKPSRRKPRRKN